MKKKKVNSKYLLLSFVVVFAVAFAGSIFTSNGANSFWYQTVKPAITPPSLVFSIVWSVIFFLIAISLYLFLTSVRNKTHKLKLEIIFAVNLLLNFLWSLFYFGSRNPSLAFFDLILIWLSIIMLIFIGWKENKKAALLLVPYLLWVSFAGVLNYLSAFG